MDGELQRLERRIALLEAGVKQLGENQKVSLAMLAQVIELLQPSTTYPGSTGGTLTVR